MHLHIWKCKDPPSQYMFTFTNKSHIDLNALRALAQDKIGLFTVPVTDGSTGPVTRVRIPSHALLFAERLQYGYGTTLSVTTRNLTAVYGRHTG